MARYWTYKGVDIHPADRNSSGIRWWALTDKGRIMADTKQGMKQLINARTVRKNTARRRRRNYWPRAPIRHKRAARKGRYARAARKGWRRRRRR